MMGKLHNLVAKYMNKTIDLDDWEDIRKKYFEYSYLAFMTLCAHEIKSDCTANEIDEIIGVNNIVEESILLYIIKIADSYEFISEVLSAINDYGDININCLYQNYIATDFSIVDDEVRFKGGKNNRDILGSYYTQEEFAYEITQKAIEEFLDNNQEEIKELKIADYSCGGGAFLVVACRICNQKRIRADIYGYDVDPIAVMITRHRLRLENGLKYEIVLGNPLLITKDDIEPLEKFKRAEIGRFYSSEMGVVSQGNVMIALGNPPWEKIRFEEKKFLMHYVDNQEIGSKAGREKYIQKISEANKIFYHCFISDYEKAKRLIKEEECFCKSSCGELNTYAIFTELCRNMVCDGGIIGLIVKSSLTKIPVYSAFFRDMTKNKDLYEVYMFTNRNKIFNIDSREEFSVVFLKKNNTKNLRVALNIERYEKFADRKKIELSYDLLNKLNPETGMIPNISHNGELEFLAGIYEKHDTFGMQYPDCKFGRLVHLTNHSESIMKQDDIGYIPIYEGKFIELYTAKYATFSGMDEIDKYKNKASAKMICDIDGEEYPESRFFIKEEVWNNLARNFNDDCVIAWRSLTSATNRRTMLATLLPLIPTCQSIQILQLPKREMLHILALFNSVVFDYIVRLKMAGLDLTQTIIKQIPVPGTKLFEKELVYMGERATIEKHINSRIKMLYASDRRLDNFFADVDTYPIKGEVSRKQIIAEIDKLAAQIYGIKQDTFKNILHEFGKYYSEKEVEAYF